MLLLWIAPGDSIYDDDIFSLEYLRINYRAMDARRITKKGLSLTFGTAP
jgi:hypothetical protein